MFREAFFALFRMVLTKNIFANENRKKQFVLSLLFVSGVCMKLTSFLAGIVRIPFVFSLENRFENLFTPSPLITPAVVVKPSVLCMMHFLTAFLHRVFYFLTTQPNCILAFNGFFSIA